MVDVSIVRLHQPRGERGERNIATFFFRPASLVLLQLPSGVHRPPRPILERREPSHAALVFRPAGQRSRRATSLYIRSTANRRTPAWRNLQEIHQRGDAAIIGTGREIGVEAPAQGANTLPMKPNPAFLGRPRAISDLNLEIVSLGSPDQKLAVHPVHRHCHKTSEILLCQPTDCG